MREDLGRALLRLGVCFLQRAGVVGRLWVVFDDELECPGLGVAGQVAGKGQGRARTS